jgi:hypothetical protein
MSNKQKEKVFVENMIITAHQGVTMEERTKAETDLAAYLNKENKTVEVVGGKIVVKDKQEPILSPKFLKSIKKDLKTLVEDNSWDVNGVEQVLQAVIRTLVFEGDKAVDKKSLITDALPSLNEKYLLTTYPCSIPLDVEDMVSQIGNNKFIEFWGNTSKLIKKSIQSSVEKAFQAQYEAFDNTLIGQVVKNKETDFVFIVQDITEGHVILQDTYEDSAGVVQGIEDSSSPVRNSIFREEYEYA